ncbi:MAG: alpha/beta hydrolase [Anaerolineales bacterium]|nr:alpha/beta hydrolase [Chloroflexota bacterium]MBL6981415.1 alpha/beta hydrolase [Anaerolineales bacterium]
MPHNANIYYFEHQGAARKPAVVLIHGAGGTHLHWPASIRRLPDHPVYALDLPGHGKSEGRSQQTIAAYAQCVLEWMDELKLDKVVFVGHSMGGGIAQTLGIQHPERVLGLGLVGTGARLKVAPALLENSARQETFPSVIDTISEWAFGPQADPRLVELAAKRMAEIRPTVLHSDFTACDAFDTRETLGKITVPCLALCGENDQLTPPRYSQYLADHIPNAEVRVIPEAGHMVMLEEPEQVAEALLSFLSTIPYQPGDAKQDSP